MKTSIRNMAFAALMLAGLSLTSCKDKDAEATDADVDTMTTVDPETETMTTEDLDETGAKDTISVTTDTITTVTP